MNRLNELADAIDPTHDSRNYSPGLAKEAAALLRAASAETVGTEWDHDGYRIHVRGFPLQFINCETSSHNTDIAAASLAVTAARKERDEARAECERLRMQVVACGVLAGSDTPESLARNSQMHPDYMCDSVRYCIDAAQRQIDRLAQIATLQKERDEAVRVLDAANDSNDRLRAAINRLEQAELSALAELDEANAKIAALQRAIDEAYGRWLLSSEMSTTSDSMARVLCPHATRRDGQQAAPVAENATPDRDKSPDTVSGSPVPTRELVARLAEAIGNYFEDGIIEVADFVIRMRDIESDASKGGAE